MTATEAAPQARRDFRVADLSLGAGEARVHQVTVVIPDDGRFDNQNGPINGRNCVAVLNKGGSPRVSARWPLVPGAFPARPLWLDHDIVSALSQPWYQDRSAPGAIART